MKPSSPSCVPGRWAMRARCAAVLLAGVAVAHGAWAGSASSAASSAGSASLGSVSDSVQGSSRSVSGQRVAQGEYRIIEIAAEPAPDGRVRLSLQSAEDRFDLLLPGAVAQRAALDVGQTLRVAHEPFGLSFARKDQAAPFFLALQADWLHEFDNRIVSL